MKKLRIAFTLSEDVLNLLKNRIPTRNRSLFVEEAIRFKFEHEDFLREMIISNNARNEELDKIDESLEVDDPFFPADESLIDEEMVELDELL